ncbi:MAG: DUF4440 domain-containing protein, partial [Candidatus Acidiferrum sp.]
MKRFVTSALAIGVLLGGMWVAAQSKPVVAETAEQSILQTDHEFVRAAAAGDKAKLATLADSDFTWTDAEGKTESRAEILKSLP